MPRFLLDTSICIELLRALSRGVASRLRRYEIDEVAISTITLAELRYGFAKSPRLADQELLLVQFLVPVAIVPFDDRAAEQYGVVRASLERAGKSIGPLDTLIASHALALDLTLVTTNTREFQRVEGLRVENWLRS